MTYTLNENKKIRAVIRHIIECDTCFKHITQVWKEEGLV